MHACTQTKQTTAFVVIYKPCVRADTGSSYNLFNTSPMHINLAGITGRCGRVGPAMAVLQGQVLWVCCVWRGRRTATISSTSEWIPSVTCSAGEWECVIHWDSFTLASGSPVKTQRLKGREISWMKTINMQVI